MEASKKVKFVLNEYQKCMKAEEAAVEEYTKLFGRWNRDGMKDEVLGKEVDRAYKKMTKAEEKTNIFARMVADYLLEEQKNEKNKNA